MACRDRTLCRVTDRKIGGARPGLARHFVVGPLLVRAA